MPLLEWNKKVGGGTSSCILMYIQRNVWLRDLKGKEINRREVFESYKQKLYCCSSRSYRSYVLTTLRCSWIQVPTRWKEFSFHNWRVLILMIWRLNGRQNTWLNVGALKFASFLARIDSSIVIWSYSFALTLCEYDNLSIFHNKINLESQTYV